MLCPRISLSVSILLLSAGSMLAGPISHAIEVDPAGSVLFVDLDRGRLLRYLDGELSVAADLTGVPEGDVRQNLVLTVEGDLYLGQKRAVWKVSADGSVESSKPPSQIKQLFINKPGDLAPDGSIYVSRDFKTIERALPGGDAHPVLTTDVISRIHSIAVSPYGRVFFANSSEIAKISAKGEVTVLRDLRGEKVFGLAALGENEVLVLRQGDGEGLRLEKLDSSGNTVVVVEPGQMAAVSEGEPLRVHAPLEKEDDTSGS